VTLAAGLAYLPVAMANNVPTLIVSIGVVGLCSGAMIPIANSLIDGWAPPGRQASAFGLVGSAMALAFAVAPLTGGAVASSMGVHASFVVIGVLLIAVSLGILLFVREPEPVIDVLEPAEATGGAE
jgi:DHA1 family multidrug resistance protein-like MFS transporter